MMHVARHDREARQRIIFISSISAENVKEIVFVISIF